MYNKTLLLSLLAVSSLFAAIYLFFPAYTRWYDHSQVTLGERVYRQYCIGCHLADASGTRDWKKTDAAGRYPPPPLDGSAHTWHHSMEVLKRQILEGGAKYRGWMPGFEGSLSEQELEAVIAYFQSKWSDETYQVWLSRNE